MVDKDLFLHDLSIVAILKCEGPYLKEWIDYHLLAGVDHFYLYDNESPDNQAEVAKPYVEAGLVDYFPFPGYGKQLVAYNDAVKRFKFQSRYMAFIDDDEFIYPKFNKIDLHPVIKRGVIELVDEILSLNPNAAGLAVNWQIFGSNGHEKADYSRGVLERFMRRAPNDWGVNVHVKTIANPRVIDSIINPHYAKYFEGKYALNQNGDKQASILSHIRPDAFNKPVTYDKIVINHYYTKSHEEYKVKRQRGNNGGKEQYNENQFKSHDRNEEFDDGILFYRDERAKVYQPPKPRSAKDLIKALEKNLSTDSYVGKMETFLTCRALSNYLGENFFEEISLKAIVKTLETSLSAADKGLFDKELPELLKLPYPVVEELRKV